VKTAAAVTCVVAVLGFGWYSSDKKIERLQQEQKIMHCQVTLYEDYSSEWKDAELTHECINQLGFKLRWNN